MFDLLINYTIMKTIILILLLTLPISMFGQRDSYRTYNNAVSVTFQPQDLGIGLMYGRSWDKFGFYVSSSKGKYRLGEDIDGNSYYINDHVKLAGGFTVKAKHTPSWLSVGLTRHFYGRRNLMPSFNYMALDPISFELGVGGDINRIRCGFRFDPIKWEGCFDFGVMF